MSKEKFTEIYKSNYWNSEESVSGSGSQLDNTENIRKKLPILFDKFGIKTILDIPCGDFNWMRYVIKKPLKYIGADIVDEIIEDCNLHYKLRDIIQFQVLDITNDSLPKVDLVIVKDCFIHFSFEDILRSLRNVKASGSKYVLITNGTDSVVKNDEIETGGGYRGLDLQLSPFNFYKPIYEIDTLVHNSRLSMWKVEDIKI